jgi:hypothetical protein
MLESSMINDETSDATRRTANLVCSDDCFSSDIIRCLSVTT